MKHTPSHTAHARTLHRLIIGNAVTSYSKVRGQSHFCLSRKLNAEITADPDIATTWSVILRKKKKAHI